MNSSYKLKRKGEKLTRRHKNLTDKFGTLKVFKPRKVVGEFHGFLQGVQKGSFENSLSLKR